MFRQISFLETLFGSLPVLFMIFGLGKSSASSGPSISTTAYKDGGMIPKKYTCDAENVSPALAFGGIPAEAKSLVLIMDDPDAPVGTWNHWLLYDIPQATTQLEQGYKPSGNVKTGKNNFGKTNYGGPCPPKGPAHRYFSRLYALNVDSLGISAGSDRAAIDSAMKGKVLTGFPVTYMGKYGR